MGARARLPALGDRAGVGAARRGSSARSAAAARGTIALATGLGAASSSCSYAAVAIAKSLFQKGASLASAMAFQFASTNLVFELGIVIWVFLGWQFTLAEFVGGLILIVLMWIGVRLLVSRREEEQARERAQAADAGHAAPLGRRLAGARRSRAGRTSRTTSAATGRCSGRRSAPAS